MDDTTTGLEVGRHRFLHPGPLRWLRALGWMVLLSVVLGLLQAGLGVAAHQIGPVGAPLKLLGVMAEIAILLGLYTLFVRLAEGRDAHELAPDKAVGGLALGVLIGTSLFCAVMAALVLSSAYAITGPRPASAWADATMALSSGFLEELALRAVIFRLVMRAFGVWPALLFSAALFGAGHLFNPNATAMAAIAIAVEAGLSLAALYLATGRLWAAIGFHLSWNFVQAYVFGARVSGIDMGASLWTSTPRAGVPVWLSGGAFGPEASAPAMVAGSILAVVALVVAHRRGRLRAVPDPGQ